MSSDTIHDPISISGPFIPAIVILIIIIIIIIIIVVVVIVVVRTRIHNPI